MKGEGGIPIDVGPFILRKNIVLLLLFIIVYSPQSPTPFRLWLSGKTKNILIIVLFFGFTSLRSLPSSVAFQYTSHFYYCIYFKHDFGRTICLVHAVRAVTMRRKKIKINMRINRERRFHDSSSFIPILLLYATADMPRTILLVPCCCWLLAKVFMDET